MMYGSGFGWGWMWIGGIAILLVLATLVALVLVIARASSTGSMPRGSHAPPQPAGTARHIAEERLARGEVTPDEFRQITRALDE